MTLARPRHGSSARKSWYRANVLSTRSRFATSAQILPTSRVSGTATASVISDPIPTFSTYAPGSITLNAASLSDAIDADAGEFDTSGAPTIVVRLGDLTQADGIQTIVFQVTIN